MNAYAQLIKERGIAWFFYRSLYALKLKTMNKIPLTERFFEKKINTISRIDLFDIDTDRLCIFLKNLSEGEKQDIIQAADNACLGRIRGFSYVDLDYGSPINWQLNPITGGFTDSSKKWFEILDFDPLRGDIKIIWEISRFAHFFLFARAYLLTDDIKYYKAFSMQLSEWLKNNSYSFGANFKCGQECALRMLSCLMVCPAFLPVMTTNDIDNVKELVSRCYRKILSNFSYAYKCQNNNHTLSELAGMIAGAWCSNDLKRMTKAYKTLDKVILNQFTSDGGYIQQSFNYQRVALQDMEAVLSMSKATGISLSNESKNRILSSALQMYQCQDVSGDMPNYGSNDGALIFPVSSCGYRDFTPCINTVYAQITGKRLYNHGMHDEELIWFNLDTTIPRETIKRESKKYEQTGLFTLRTDKYWLMLVAKNNINHMDQNHLDLWCYGKNIFCDSGTYSYVDDIGRELFATKAHNTVYCEGKEQIYRLGAFAVYGQPKLNNVKWTPVSIDTEISYASGYTHCRTLELIEDELIITDKIKGHDDKPLRAKVLFHTP